MKTILIQAILALYTVNIFAQTGKGTIVVGSGFQFSNNKNGRSEIGSINSNSDYISSFNVSQTIGYFLADNFEFGLDYSYDKQKSDYTQTTETTGDNTITLISKYTYITNSIGAFSKYHRLIYQNLGILGEINTAYCHIDKNIINSQEYSNNPSFNYNKLSERKGPGINASIRFGLEYYIKKQFRVELELWDCGYYYESLKEKANIETGISENNKVESRQNESHFYFLPFTIPFNFKFNILIN